LLSVIVAIENTTRARLLKIENLLSSADSENQQATHLRILSILGRKELQRELFFDGAGRVGGSRSRIEV
jgi:hypothetical protein